MTEDIDITNPVAVTFPLKTFMERYAPLFTSGEFGLFTQEWLKVAGTIYGKVKLIGDDVNYITPPLKAHFVGSTNDVTGGVANRATQLNERVRGSAEAYLNHKLPLLLRLDSPENQKLQNENALKWRKLLVELKVPLFNSTVSTVESSTETNTGDGISVDDDGEW